ncbi:MAG: tetratricopeptide repeat protein [Sphingorhabdus sp.]
MIQPRAELNIRAIDGESLSKLQDNPLARGKAHLALGQNALAISDFRAALRSTPDSATAYNGLGIAYDRIGRRDLAQLYFELAVANAPSDLKFSGNLARFLEASGKPQMAQGLVAPVAIADTAQLAEQEVWGKPDGRAAVPPIALQADRVSALTASSSKTLATEIAASGDSVRHASVVPSIRKWDAPRPARGRHAVFQAAAPIPIGAASIDRQSLPGKPLPVSPPKHPPADAPPSPVALPTRETTRLERVSLGEVRLVTQSPAGLPRFAKVRDFASFEDRLASWLPDAIAIERRTDDAVRAQGLALQRAVARAKLELAVYESGLDPSGKVERKQFTYAFFDGDDLVETSLALL